MAVGLIVVPAATGQAVQQPQANIVSEDPVDWTPDVLDGEVESIVEVAGKIVVAGTFTQVKEKGQSSPILDRSGLFAFDPANGKIDPNFAPRLDNSDVRVVLPAADGSSVYAAGAFKFVNGVFSRNITRLDVATGQIVSGFSPSLVWAKIVDLRLVRDQLVVVGSFTVFGGEPRTGLTSLDAATGKVSNFMTATLGSPRYGADASAMKMDLSPDGSRLVIIGNFGTVNGESRPQLAVFDTSGSTATLSPWRTGFYALDQCSKSFWSYMRDVDIDPTGKYFVVSTTGAYGGGEGPCDVIARFEFDAAGSAVEPSWRAYTGGDTSYAVAVTGTAVYVGGHMRWMNNPWAGDRPGAGAVPRDGITALDPKSGTPYQWNPGRQPRGVGVFDMLATDRGLYIGSDTDWVGDERHRKLAFFPLEGGTSVPAGSIGSLANDVYLFSKPGSTDDAVRKTYFDGVNAPGAVDELADDLNGPANWSQARAATLIDGTIYSPWSDGSLRAQSFDGITFGEQRSVELYGTSSSPGAAKWFGSDAAKVTGMFFDPADNRIYYTMTGDASLYWRAFNPESEVVGAARFKATGDVSALGPKRVAGMFLSGSDLYLADQATGNLLRITFDRGVVTGPVTVAEQSIDWRARGAFVWNGTPSLPLADPIAAFETTCAGLVCQFDGSTSSDPDGEVVDWAWTLGPNDTASGQTAQWTFPAAGDYEVSLRVTDNRGQTGVTQKIVSVEEAPIPAIEFRAEASSSANVLTAELDVPAEVQEGDLMLLFWSVNTNAAASGPPAGWTYVDGNSGRGMETRLYAKITGATDAGTKVSVTNSDWSKTDLNLVAYSGVDVTSPILDVVGSLESETTTTHVSPDLEQTADTSFVVSYWADKSSATTAWTLPAGLDLRSLSLGSGGGRITSVVADSPVVPSPSGTLAGHPAEANSATAKASMWSISLRQAAG